MSKAHLLPVLATAAGLVIGGCTAVRNPATGETQYTSLTPADEAKLGREESTKALSEYGGAYANRQLQAYVAGIGERLGKVSDLPDLKFTFTVLDSDIVNAFSLPGGYVYISRGLLALADNEAEVAGVLAHEIGHVTARHVAQRYDRAKLGQLGALGATVLGGLLLGDVGAQAGQQLGGVGAEAYVQGYSREQEFQADELGVRYLARAGYDPEAMVTLLSALQANDELQQKLTGRKDEGGVSSWFADHPRTADRVQRAASEAESSIPTGKTVDRDRYLAAIDGLVYGDSPEQGYVRGRVFEHPGLRLRFTAPEGFKLVNTPTRVLGQDGRGRMMQFDGGKARAGEDLSAYLQREWVHTQRLSDVKEVSTEAGPAAIGFGRVGLSGKLVPAMFAVVRGDGAEVWRFVFIDQHGLKEEDIIAFTETVRSVQALSVTDAAAIQPLRVEVVTVRPEDSIDSLAARMEVEKLPRDTFVVLNDLQSRTPLPGEKVKIIRRSVAAIPPAAVTPARAARSRSI